MPHTACHHYTGEHQAHVAFPLGGIGAGMICLEGNGALSHVSLRHRPEVNNEPLLFAALAIKGETPLARVLEGPTPAWKIFAQQGAGNGLASKTYGLPRFPTADFSAQFPFAAITLDDEAFPLFVEVTAWSPFVPGDAAASSLPVAMLEYRLLNRTKAPVEAVYSFHAANLLAKGDGPRGVRPTEGGFILWQQGAEPAPWDTGAFQVAVDDAAAVDCRWFRGGWFDALTMLWKAVAAGEAIARPPVTDGEPSPGGSLYVPVTLAPGEERTIRLRLCWYVPLSNIRIGTEATAKADCGCSGCGCAQTVPATLPTYRPWYAGRFPSIEALGAYWASQAETLRAHSALFRDTFFDSTLPDEVLEAVAANLSILKSPTLLRQEDGRLWCFEGCCDGEGCCHGSCTHVWNYAQALPHLFPELERTLRRTEFFECQDERGHQGFRADLPIRPLANHDFHAAADGQLGGIMKVYRDWRISGDSGWLRDLWPRVRQSLRYCIATWDPDHTGWLPEPHHNTYDIEFWGPDGMCTSFYLGALLAAARMAEALGEEREPFATLAERSRTRLEHDLFNGEYFIQQIRWQGLRASDPLAVSASSMAGAYSPEARELLQREGPKYQYGNGCLSDGVLGAWIAEMSGLGTVLDAGKLTAHLRAVHRYNLRHDLSAHANPQRPGYALGKEGGLLLCSWPHGGALSLPFVYSNEVWTGIEYQVAAHLMLMGCVDEGLEIVRTARARYDGRVRNPFNEYECGHWYGRVLSSYGLLQGLSGARYDAVDHVLYLHPRISGDFRAFLCTATGYGVVGVRGGRPFLETRSGEIPVERIEYQP